VNLVAILQPSTGNLKDYWRAIPSTIQPNEDHNSKSCKPLTPHR